MHRPAARVCGLRGGPGASVWDGIRPPEEPAAATASARAPRQARRPGLSSAAPRGLEAANPSAGDSVFAPYLRSSLHSSHAPSIPPSRPDARASSSGSPAPSCHPRGRRLGQAPPPSSDPPRPCPARPSGSALCRARAPRAALDGDRVGRGVCVTWLLWRVTDTRFGETHSGRSACVCVAPFRGFLDGAPCSAAPCFVMVTVKSPLREDPPRPSWKCARSVCSGPQRGSEGQRPSLRREPPADAPQPLKKPGSSRQCEPLPGNCFPRPDSPCLNTKEARGPRVSPGGREAVSHCRGPRCFV